MDAATAPPSFREGRIDEAALEALRPDFSFVSISECRARKGALGYSATTHGDVAADTLLFVMAESASLDAQQWFESAIERMRPAQLLRCSVRDEDLSAWLDRSEHELRAMDAVQIDDELQADDGAVPGITLSLASIESADSPTVRLVDSTLYDALKAGASDIHFEVQGRTLHVKYRLDGVLQSVKRIESSDIARQAVSRIKVLADLDITERRVPQDGRFRVVSDRREIDFRVSIMPNLSGEDAVLRILDRKHLTGQFDTLSLDSLNFDEQVKAFVRRVSRLPYGLLLVTGPTGSGKTTTLYAAISEINSGLDKIVTIEDPIEYQLNGILQIPVNEKKGLTFARGLRSILRHDPDKIMVGEIRDSETAQIAVQAALTGHQVFTTVHANNVFDVIGRFSNMGVDSYSLVAALSGIMAQRLVRLVCPRCVAKGCAHCRGTGYKGRAAIAETLAIDDEMKDLLVQQAPITRIKQAARAKGFLGLRDAAVAMAASGRTTVEEINRVTPAE